MSDIRVNVTGPAPFIVSVTGAVGASPLITNGQTFAVQLAGVGPTGPRGAAGQAGSQGEAGPVGPTGAASTVAGPTGPTGAVSTVPGPTGASVVGATGPAGIAGGVGATGPTGARGIDGAAGQSITGPAGTSGQPGSTGPTGARGVDGAAGQSITGPTGPAGQQGDSGLVGATGATGARGSDGAAGQSVTGPTGASGSDGAATTSASDLTSGTLPDARLSGSVLLAAALAARQHQTTSFIDAIDRTALTTAVPPVSNAVYWTFFTPAYALTISQIAYACTTAAAGVTLCRYGIYTADASGTATLVARTASDTTIFNASNTVFTRSLDTTGGYPASYTLTAGTRYAVAICIAASNTGSVSGAACPGVIAALSPRVQGVRTGANDLLASQGAGQYNGTVGQTYWARLS